MDNTVQLHLQGRTPLWWNQELCWSLLPPVRMQVMQLYCAQCYVAILSAAHIYGLQHFDCSTCLLGLHRNIVLII